MSRTFISQPNQVFHSEHYNDALTPGVTLQSTSTSLESDLNAIRTQIRQLLWANVSGSWYDTITAPSGSLSARGLNTINADLTDLEQKRFLFRVQNLNLVNVGTGSNVALLSVSLGTAPQNFVAVSGQATGTVVFPLDLSTQFGTFNSGVLSGSSVLTPKNLVLIRDAWTGTQITGSSNRNVYGLLQVESGSNNGDTFNDSTHRTQISFVVEGVTNGTSSLVPALTSLIGGKTVTYEYVKRTALDGIPEDAYLSDQIFFNMGGGTGTGTGNANLSDITLDRAIDNQTGVVTQDQNIDIRIAAGFHWAFLSGVKELWRLDSSDTTDVLTVAVDRFAVSSSSPTTFQQGVMIATGSTPILVGVAVGTIQTLSGSNLILSGGAKLGFSDLFGPTSTYTGGFVPLATSTSEWNSFFTGFGAASILGAFNFLSQSLSSSVVRTRTTAGVTTNVSADTNVTVGTNLDAQLGSYVGKNFISDVNVFLNGQLLLPGVNSSSPNDVYPGTTPATGDLKFPYSLLSGTQITIEIFK